MSPQAFSDLEPISKAAKRLRKHPRTLMRWTEKPDGLPYIRLGRVPYLHIPTTDAWIAARMKRPNPTHPPRRGTRES